MPDIDIDFADRTIALEKLKHRVAKLDTGKKHNTGVYVTECPHNPVDNLCTVDYKTAEDRGYFKLDFLNVSIYDKVRDEEHLRHLMNKEPLWELLEEKDFCDLVFHVSGHHELIKKLNNNIVDTKFPIEWNHYRNTIMLTQQGTLKMLKTKIYQVIEL